MLFIAHRANDNHSFLENTLEAINYCLNKNYIDGIEIDIRLTKDKKIVVFHNMIIDLSSNGTGLIKNKTLNQLKKYRFGINQKISTLEEVLKIMNDKLLLIEIKEESKNYYSIVNQTYKLIKKYPKLNIIICSFNYELLEYLKKIDKHIKSCLLISLIINNDKIYNHLNYNSLNIKQVKKAKKNDFIWTVNDINQLKKINENLNIITDVAYKLNND